MEFIKVNINKLKNAKYNPRKKLTPEDKEYQKIKKSIEEFGYVDPIIINADYTIIGGHQRLSVLKDLGYKEIEVIQIDIDKTKEKALNIALNKITGEWDYNLLQDLLVDLNSINYDLNITGFDTEEIDEILNPLEPEKEYEVVEVTAPAPKEEPKARLGDIYQLGNHRLMCGDSTSEKDVKKLMGKEIADLVVTDPPYNVDYTGKTKEALKIKNDKMSETKFGEFLNKAFKNMELSLKKGGAYYIWYAASEHINFETALNKNNMLVKQQLIWNKNSMVLGMQDYQWKHEACLYGWKEGKAHYFIDDRKQTTVIEDKVIDFKKLKKEELIQLLEDIYSDKVSTTIINEKRPSVSDIHPTMKPIKLIARLIKNSSKRNELVLDLFGGSGSTLMACEQIERNCYMMEYDPIYVDVIIKRWEDFAGQKAIKINK